MTDQEKHKIISETIDFINLNIYQGNWSKLNTYIRDLDPNNHIEALTAARGLNPIKLLLSEYDAKLDKIIEVFTAAGKLDLLKGLRPTKTQKDYIMELKANIDLWLVYADQDVNLDYLFNNMQNRLDKAKACPRRK